MTTLFVWPPERLGRSVVARFIEEGDEVRVLVPVDHDDGYRSLGAHVAMGDPLDPDLVERAAQNTDTIMFLDAGGNFAGHLQFALESAQRAGVGRAIVTSSRSSGWATEALDATPLEYVYLLTGQKRWGRRGVAEIAIVEAVSAADDLAGSPRLTVDLETAEGWAALRLEPR